MRDIERARLDPKRLENLPKGEKHWNFNPNPSILALSSVYIVSMVLQNNTYALIVVTQRLIGR
jgi:hypothetical protein